MNPMLTTPPTPVDPGQSLLRIAAATGHPDADTRDTRENRKAILKVLATLPLDWSLCLVLRATGMPFRMVGRLMGCSAERVRQKVAKAVGQLAPARKISKCTCHRCPPGRDAMYWRQDEEAACERRAFERAGRVVNVQHH